MKSLEKYRLAGCALAVFVALMPVHAADYRAAVFVDPALEGCDVRTAEVIERAFGDRGAATRRVDCLALSDLARFNAETYDCLVYTCGSNYPEEAEKSILAFLAGGGDMILTGGRFFRRPYAAQGGKFVKIPLRRIAVKGYPVKLSVAPKKLAWNGLGLLADTVIESELYRLDGTTAVRRESQEYVRFDFPEFAGSFDGYSAIVWPIIGQSEMIPLLGAYDRYGRNLGWAASVTFAYAGKHKGSCVAAFGITDAAFYRDAHFESLAGALCDAFRDATIPAALEAAFAASKKKTFPVTSPPLEPLAIKKNSFVDAKGRPVFLAGVNWAGSLRTFNGHPSEVEGDFMRLKSAGVNAVRVMGNAWTRKDYLELARRHNIRLIPDLRAEGDENIVRGKVSKAAAAAARNEAVLALDFCNEPYIWKLAKQRNAAGKRLGELYPTGGFRAYLDKYVAPGWQTAFPMLADGRFPAPAEAKYRKLIDNSDAVLKTWLSWCTGAMADSSPELPVTVGYNTYPEWFPANDVLDFASHHVYERPVNYEAVVANMTVLDRLAKRYPGKPVTIGEFGYGDNEFLEDGSAMTAEAAAVGEIATYLYGFAHGYAGVFKWVLDDQNLRSFMAQMKFAREKFEEHPDDIFKRPKYGMYYPDGAGNARPKPIVHALKFFSEYVAGRPPAGTLRIYPSKNRIGTGFTYRGEGVFFVGDNVCNEKELAFAVDPAHPAIVMVRRERDGVLLMAASDVTVRLHPSAFGIEPGGDWRVSGKCAAFDGGTCVVSLLKGERVRIVHRG